MRIVGEDGNLDYVYQWDHADEIPIDKIFRSNDCSIPYTRALIAGGSGSK